MGAVNAKETKNVLKRGRKQKEVKICIIVMIAAIKVLIMT